MLNYCYKHADTETALSCGHCNRPICVKCVVQHPVGIRCPECGRPTKIPQWDITPAYYARAIGAAAAISIAGVAVLRFLSALPLGILGYYAALAALVGTGYLVGQGISRVVGGKRGRELQWVAGVAMGITAFVALPFIGFNFFALITVAAAVYIAVNQLRI